MGSRNVIKKLNVKNSELRNVKHIKQDIIDFIGDDKEPEFWADYCSYDWVVFCQIFGTMMDLPNDFPMFCMDIQQLKKTMNHAGPLPELDVKSEHNALNDAKNCKERYEFLMSDKFNLKKVKGDDNEL